MKTYKRIFKEETKLATSPSLEGINKIINQYFYSDITLNKESDTEYSLHNKKGLMNNYIVVFKKKRFLFLEK